MEGFIPILVFLIILVGCYFLLKKEDVVLPASHAAALGGNTSGSGNSANGGNTSGNNTPPPTSVPLLNPPASVSSYYQKFPGVDFAFGHMTKDYGQIPYEYLGNYDSEEKCQQACSIHNHDGHGCDGYTWYGPDYEANTNIRNRCFTAPAVGHSGMSLVGAYSGLRETKK